MPILIKFEPMTGELDQFGPYMSDDFVLLVRMFPLLGRYLQAATLLLVLTTARLAKRRGR